MKKILFGLFAFLLAISCDAQKHYMPIKAEFIRHTPSGPPNDMFNVIEQRGVVPYKGRDCEDGEGTGILEGENGKRYGSNIWVDVHLQIQHYKPAAKPIFDNAMQYNPPAQELANQEAAYKAEPTEGYLSRDIKVIDVTNGKMLVVKDVQACVQSKYKQYTTIFVRSYAVVGTTIIWIDANYYSDDVSLATKIHAEIIEKIQKTGVE